MGRNRDDLGMTPSELERMEVWGRRIILEAKLGHTDRAKVLIDEYTLEENASDDRDLASVRLAEVLSDQAVLNILERDFHCLSIGDAFAIIPQVLLGTQSLGATRVAVLYQEMAKFAVQKCRAHEKELGNLRHQNGNLPNRTTITGT